MFGLQHFSARHLQEKLHTADMSCSVQYLTHLSRHLHRAHRLPLPCCSLQLGLPLKLCCLAVSPNNLLYKKRRRSPQRSQKIASPSTKVKLTLKRSVPSRWECSHGNMFFRRPPALSEGEIATLTAAVRQLGVGSQGGAEALAIFNELIFGGWASGPLDMPLARIKVDNRNCFGLTEWGAVRNSESSFSSKKHARRSSTDAQRSSRRARRR